MERGVEGALMGRDIEMEYMNTMAQKRPMRGDL